MRLVLCPLSRLGAWKETGDMNLCWITLPNSVHQWVDTICVSSVVTFHSYLVEVVITSSFMRGRLLSGITFSSPVITAQFCSSFPGPTPNYSTNPWAVNLFITLFWLNYRFSLTLLLPWTITDLVTPSVIYWTAIITLLNATKLTSSFRCLSNVRGPTNPIDIII